MTLYTFNFNPEKEDIHTFISNIIIKISGDKLQELANKQTAIDVISKNLDTIAEDKKTSKKKGNSPLKTISAVTGIRKQRKA